MSRIRLGMVGGGEGAFIGAVHRMAARIDDRYAFVAAAPSSDAERARRSGAALGLEPERIYADFREMARAESMRADGAEVISIVTPNHLHHDAALACLDAGLHVMCDKPLTRTLAEAQALLESARASGRVFGVTYTYSGYPMVRQAREMAAAGELGDIRLVHVEYLQDWLATPLEASGHKQAAWRTDPALSGPAGCLGDIGTHAFHLVRFITGLEVKELAAELHTFVPGRRVDDDAQVRLRFANGARGHLWASQVATGHANALAIRVYGTTASLAWQQEAPETLAFTRLGEAPQTLRRGGAGAGTAARAATRIPGGHPEGYLEAFAQLYRDLADQIEAHRDGRTPPAHAGWLPDITQGVEGMRFVDASLRSHRAGAQWVGL
jgi:predicted dehydrogenase